MILVMKISESQIAHQHHHYHHFSRVSLPLLIFRTLTCIMLALLSNSWSCPSSRSALLFIWWKNHFKNEIGITYELRKRIMFLMIFISEGLGHWVRLYRCLFLSISGLHHLLGLSLLNNLPSCDACCLLICRWNAAHNQIGVTTLSSSRGQGHHGSGSAEGHFGRQGSHSEENVDIVSVENLSKIAVHFIDLNQGNGVS